MNIEGDNLIAWGEELERQNERLRAALEGMVAHRGRPQREEYLSDAAFSEAARAFQRAQEALNR